MFGVAVYALSGARPQTPDLDEFLDGDSRPGTRRRCWPASGEVCRRHLPGSDRTTIATTPSVASRTDRRGPGAVRLRRVRTRGVRDHRRPRPSWRHSGDALVVCVWQPVDVGFTPTDGKHFDADRASEVRRAAERTAAHGASLADEAGFRRCSVAVEAAPTWKGIVAAADEHDASLIVLGPHRRNGLLGHLQGSVAAAVVAHYRDSGADHPAARQPVEQPE